MELLNWITANKEAAMWVASWVLAGLGIIFLGITSIIKAINGKET